MRQILSWFVLIALTTGIYLPGLSGGFFFDDFPNIVDNPSIQIARLDRDFIATALSGPVAGPLGRPLSMLSFALTHLFFGLDPLAFKAVNLAIHLVNGLLAAWLMRLLIDVAPSTVTRRWLPLWVAAVWIVHPINVMPVLLSVQRMTLLSGMFVIIGLIAHVKGLCSGDDRRFAWLAAGWLFFWPLAVLSKETGLLFPLYALLVSLLLKPVRLKALFAGIVLLTTAVAGIIIAWLGWGWLEAGYAMRSFTLGERLLTEARILWFYLGQILLPSHAAFGFYLDDIPLSTGLWSPPLTAYALAGWAIIIALIVRFWRKMPIICFGLAWFLVGHLLESTFLPLEVAFEYRNYLPALGLVLMAGWIGIGLLSRVPLDHPRFTFGVLAILPLVFLALLTWMRADQWGDPIRAHQIETAYHPHSARANYMLSTILIQSGRGDAGDFVGAQMIRYHLLEAAAADPAFKSAYLGLLVWACGSGRELDGIWIQRLAARLENTPFGPKDKELPDDLLKPLIGMPRCLPFQDGYRLFEAGSRNTRIPASLRARFLEAAGDYALLAAIDPSAARAYFLRANALDAGNIRLQSKLAGLNPKQ